jgi:4-hydroxy-3-methylbut-2-en-1-yl diphosphate reductase
MQTVERIREQFPNLLDPPSDDICYATQNRQQAVKKIADGADLVLVVGSANSSNSVRLVEVALESGARAAYRIDDVSEIRESWLDGVRTVGVTSGASVPEDLVDGVLDYLRNKGFPAAKAVPTAEESLIFALPPELRRALKASDAAVAGTSASAGA